MGKKRKSIPLWSAPTATPIADILKVQQLAKKYERKPDEDGNIWLTQEQYAAFLRLEQLFGLGPDQTPIPDEEIFDRLQEWAGTHE